MEWEGAEPVTYVLLVRASLIEIGENDRMRAEIDPLLIVLLASGLSAGYRRICARRTQRGAERL